MSAGAGRELQPGTGARRTPWMYVGVEPCPGAVREAMSRPVQRVTGALPTCIRLGSNAGEPG